MHTLALSLMRMPVETTVIRVDGAEDTGFQPPFSGGIQQILHRQTAHVIQQPTVPGVPSRNLAGRSIHERLQRWSLYHRENLWAV